MEFKKIKLKEVVDIINGRAYKQEELLNKGKYKVLRVGNFFSSDNWYYSDMELSDEKYCEKGDLLYAWSATFGPKIWENEKSIYHYHIWKLKLKENIDKYYLYYYLLFITEQLKSATHGSVMLHLTKSDMENFLISIPSIENQRKIGYILYIIDNRIKQNTHTNDNLLYNAA